MAPKSAPSEYAKKQAAKRIFDTKTIRRGRSGLLYRSYVDVETKSSLKYLKQEAQDRGLHIVRIDKFYVVICGEPTIEIIC